MSGEKYIKLKKNREYLFDPEKTFLQELLTESPWLQSLG